MIHDIWAVSTEREDVDIDVVDHQNDIWPSIITGERSENKNA
jgi:hypothetical protein